MGQKTNPKALRLQLDKNWTSKWFENRKLTDNLLEDLAVRSAIEKKLGRQASVDKIEIKRDAREILAIIYTAKPGIVIGRSGQGINDLNKFLEKIIESKRNEKKPWEYFKKTATKNKMPNKKIKIEIMEISEPELRARLMAQNIATQLEKRVSYRRAVKQAITRILQNKKALGVKVIVAGRLGGVEIARRERFSEGPIPLGTFKQDIDYAQENAYTTYGVVGVKVWIYKSGKNSSLNK